MANGKKYAPEDLSNLSNIIGRGSTLVGDIQSEGNIRVEGRITGNIKSKSKIAVGESAYVEGNLKTQNAEIAGEIRGKVEISELLIIKHSAVINGEIKTNKIVIESGAVFNGKCKMDDSEGKIVNVAAK